MRTIALTALITLTFSLHARELQTPAAAGGVHPFLTSAPDGSLLMAWTEPAGGGHAVRFASFAKGRWSEPRTIVRRDDLFVNWADFPSIAVTADGTLFAHWLQKSSPGKYSYDVHVASSRDGGRTWSRSRAVHRDGTPTEHGFVSMIPVRRDAVGVVWLDGRNMKGEEHGGEMTLRYARIDARGNLAREDLLDSRVCECCTTGMAASSGGPVIVYRDRSPEEIRDISYVRWSKGRWSKPAPLHRDGWKIEGCPVNGPQIDARGDLAAAAWFTAAAEKGRVNVVFSTDGGATFGAPIRVDGGSPTGRVDLLLLEDGSALVTWIDGLGDEAHIAMRRVRRDGRMTPVQKAAVSSTARGSGFPRMAIIGEEVYLTWTEPSTPRRIRMMALPIPRM